MMRRRLFALLGLLLVAGIAALAVLPARWLMAALPGHGPLAIVDASGTIWSGTATLAVGPPHQRRRLAAPLRWRWSFSPGPRVQLAHPWLDGPLMLAFSPAGMAISSQTLTLPAQALATLDARIAAIGPEGRLLLRWPATRIGRSAPNGEAGLLEAEWRDAASALTPLRPLGHYRLTVSQDEGGSAKLALTTLQGPLLLEGNGSLNRRQSLQFSGSARADPTADAMVHAALQDVLGALGPRQNNVTLLQYR